VAFSLGEASKTSISSKTPVGWEMYSCYSL